MKHAHKFYIDGQWVEPLVSKILEVIDPSTEQPTGTIALGSAADAEKAVAAARRAFASFSQSPKEERVELLKRIVTILKRRNDEPRRCHLTGNGRAARHGPGRAGRPWCCPFRADDQCLRDLCLRLHAGDHAHRARAGRGRCDDHAVELADQPDRLQGRSGARHRLHHGAEAFGDRSLQCRDLRRDHG